MKENKFKVGDTILVKGIIAVIDTSERTNYHYNINLPEGGTHWIHDNYVCAPPIASESKAYEQGLEDAWKVMRKLIMMTFSERDDALGTTDSTNGYANIIENFTAADVMEKLKAWEETYIRPGDVVEIRSLAGSIYTGVVTQITDAQNNMCVLYKDGSVEVTTKNNTIKKVGRSIDIEDLLGKI